MDYGQTLEWLYNQLPIFQRVGGAAYKANLKKTFDLLTHLKNPQENFKAVHIAGTNGKGSVSHMIASTLQEAGYKTGLYTSPHLRDFRERIKINGKMISADKVVDFVSENKSHFEKIRPSFFEMTVGMAFDHFSKEKVDIAVLETGMGGRLDSTNICSPVLTIITNIGYDHMQFLGNTLEEIAHEKAGIIKKNIPLVIGTKQFQTNNVFEKIAKKNDTPLSYADEHFDVKALQTRNKQARVYDVWKDNLLYIEALESPLLGNYQDENIATVLQALSVLNFYSLFEIKLDNIKDGIIKIVENTGFQGRWQVINSNPLTICDMAHNIDGLRTVVDQLLQTSYEKLHIVFGMVSDKSTEQILQLLPQNASYYFCKPDIPRGMDADQLADQAEKSGLKGMAYHSVQHALNSATNNARVNDLVFVGGSTFVVAEVI